MVCFACNGKGYVRINDRELPCYECQGRGEFPVADADRQKALEPVHSAFSALSERTATGV